MTNVFSELDCRLSTCSTGSLHSQGVAQASACEDERIGLLVFDECGVDFVFGYEFYAGNFKLFFHIRPQSVKILMGSFDRRGEFQQASRGAFLFVKGYVVATQGCNACGFHACRAGAYNHDIFFRFCSVEV